MRAGFVRRLIAVSARCHAASRRASELAGSFGLFFTLFLLFLRFVPILAMAEVKAVMPQAHEHGHDEGSDASAEEVGLSGGRP